MNNKDLAAMNEYENIKNLAIEKGLKYDGVYQKIQVGKRVRYGKVRKCKKHLY